MQREYNDEYYEEMLSVVERFSGYSVLWHLDLIKRYDPKGVYPFENNRDAIAAILERAISDGGHRGQHVEFPLRPFRPPALHRDP